MTTFPSKQNFEASEVSIAKLEIQQAALSPRSSKQLPLPTPSPFLKWAGGKGKLLTQLKPLLPSGIEMMRHVEPFVGGGAFFFHQTPERALLCDVNPALINVYESIRNHPHEVIRKLRKFQKGHNEEHFYEQRERYNQSTRLSDIHRAALFIYLNKTCFNGLHRVNKKGHFNVPMGRYKNPKILDELGIFSASLALQNAEIRCDSFDALLEQARPGDFVYLDPPYEPISETSSFTSYAKNGFSQEDQERLRDVFFVLDKRGCKLMLSNSDVPFIRKLYSQWHIDIVAAPRAISCHGKDRKKVTEVVVRNYTR